LVRQALTEKRVILTQDRALPGEWRVSGVYLVEAIEPLEQLREVARHFGLGGRLHPFTRCSRCNAQLSIGIRNCVFGNVR
jgi:hypothetical protein